MVNTTKLCLCCGEQRDIITQYDIINGKSAVLCVHCIILSPNEICGKTAIVQQREYTLALETRAGRKELRHARRRAQYASIGKRCASCHHFKSPAAYHRCASQGDGLQAYCIECNKLKLSLVSAGASIATWKAVRDAMRAAASKPAK